MGKTGESMALASAIFAAIALAALACIGLTDALGIYESGALRAAFFPTDIANLALGLPFALLAIFLSARGRAAGRLLLAGFFVYGFYVCLPYAVVLPMGPQRILAALVMASSLAGLLDHLLRGSRELAASMPERLPRRFPAAVLLGLGILVLGRQAAQVAAALGKAETAPASDLALWLADLGFMVPLMIASGISLLRRGKLGLAAGPGILAAYAALSLGLVPWFLYQASMKGEPVDLAGIVVVCVMALLCIAPLALMLAAQRSRVQAARGGVTA